MINIYLTNLAKYNEGELLGEWLELPATEEEIKEALENIGTPEEYFISDYDTAFYGLDISEFANIKELNALAEELKSLDAYELEAVQAYLLAGDNVFIAMSQVKEANYRIYNNCYSMSDVAFLAIAESGILDNAPCYIADYFDFEAYGRDLDITGDFYKVGNDFVEIYL